MNRERLQKIQGRFELPAYRIDLLRRAFFIQAAGAYEEVTTLPKKLRAELEITGPALRVQPAGPEAIRSAADGRAHKALLRLNDGAKIESVLLQPKPGVWSCCISCEVGCRFGCRFCATGSMGLQRRLEAEEISDQVLFWRHFLAQAGGDEHLHSVVYMGMGEPFDNRDAVFASLDELISPDALRLGARRISVSTVGLVPGIQAFTQRFPQVNLAVSLHSADEELRRYLIPAAKKYPLIALRAAIDAHLTATRRKVFFEYNLMRGINDRHKDASQLVDYIQSFSRPSLIHVNLIACNQVIVRDVVYAAPERVQMRRFSELLADRGIHVSIRKSLGRDIDGACGQLATTRG